MTEPVTAGRSASIISLEDEVRKRRRDEIVNAVAEFFWAISAYVFLWAAIAGCIYLIVPRGW
jgi:uncharacterized membrane protein YraQ (UPF0718 family)